MSDFTSSYQNFFSITRNLSLKALRCESNSKIEFRLNGTLRLSDTIDVRQIQSMLYPSSRQGDGMVKRFCSDVLLLQLSSAESRWMIDVVEDFDFDGCAAINVIV